MEELIPSTRSRNKYAKDLSNKIFILSHSKSQTIDYFCITNSVFNLQKHYQNSSLVTNEVLGYKIYYYNMNHSAIFRHRINIINIIRLVLMITMSMFQLVPILL